MRLFRGGRAVAAAAWLGCGAAWGHGGSHGGGGHDVAAVLDPLPAALRGVRVELHRTLAAQLVVENRTGKALEILDAKGRAFLRIGPERVEADLHAADWYRSFTETGIPMPAAAKDGSAPARWSPVGKGAAWGWFDLRLRGGDVAVPKALVDARREGSVGRWKIAVRFDGKPATLAGSFRYTPPPAGQFVARIDGSGELAPGVSAQLLPGPVPGLYVANSSGEPLTVLGRDGEAFLRIGPDGVYANVRSPTWQTSGQAEVGFEPAEPADAKAPPRWVLRSPSPRFSWIETRAAYPEREPPSTVVQRGARAEVRRWVVPMRRGEHELKLVGATDWVPFERR